MPDKFVPTGAAVSTLSNGLRPLSLELPHRDDRAPTVNDVIYPIGKFWIDLSEEDLWFLNNFYYTSGRLQANWVKFGGPALVELNVQFATAPGVDPVEPTTAGVMNLNGSIVANGTNASQPLATHTRALNTANLELQLGTTVSPTPADTVDVGVFSANEDHFTVDATSGMLSIKGGAVTPPVSKVDVDFNTAPGVDPVVATAAGLINHRGNVVTNGTNANAPVATHSRAVNTYQTDVQLAAAVAATPADPFDVGLASFNNTQFTCDSNGFTELIDPPQVPGIVNLGISYSAGTFTVNSADSTALSATNVATVVIPSTGTPGKLNKYTITANQTFQDSAGTSNLAGNTFGVSIASGLAWNVDMPFYLYAIENGAAGSPETTVRFGISRLPNLSITPRAANIGTDSTANADVQGSMFIMGDPTIADYAASSCVCIGAFRMRATTNIADWTVQALIKGATTVNSEFIGADGIGCFHENSIFSFPLGAMGARADSFFANNSGTAPEFSSGTASYSVQKDSKVTYSGDTGICDASGVGAVDLQLVFPFTTIDLAQGNGNFYNSGNTGISILEKRADGLQVGTFLKVNPTTLAVVQNQDITNTNEGIKFWISFIPSPASDA